MYSWEVFLGRRKFSALYPPHQLPFSPWRVQKKPPRLSGLHYNETTEEKVAALVVMDQVRGHPDGEELRGKIVSRTKGDMATHLLGFSVMESDGIEMNIPLQKHPTLSNRRPTHCQRPSTTERNRSSQCESRDFFPSVTRRHLFKVTSSNPFILPSSLHVRGMRLRKEKKRSKRQGQVPFPLLELELQVWQPLNGGEDLDMILKL